jgi:hypothetical protein
LIGFDPQENSATTNAFKNQLVSTSQTSFYLTALVNLINHHVRNPLESRIAHQLPQQDLGNPSFEMSFRYVRPEPVLVK